MPAEEGKGGDFEEEKTESCFPSIFALEDFPRSLGSGVLGAMPVFVTNSFPPSVSTSQCHRTDSEVRQLSVSDV